MRFLTLSVFAVGALALMACDPKPEPAPAPPAAPVQTHEDRMLDAQARDMEAQMQAQLDAAPAKKSK
ncbi:hypothetical protein BH09PSE1_BH09PSE1_14520 [soil metagenome]